MKTKLGVSLTFLFLSGVNASSLRTLPVENVYTPSGFDANDNVQIIVSGYLPNQCYENPRGKVEIQENEIKIQMVANRKDSFTCPESIKKFLKVINLGRLDPSIYDIKVTNRNSYPINEEIRIVDKASGNIDKYRYPIVTNLSFERKNHLLKIKGYKQSDCYNLKSVDFYSDNKDTIIALPIMEKIRNFCPKKLMPIDVAVTVPRLVNSLQNLIHVRSQNNNSKNIETHL